MSFSLKGRFNTNQTGVQDASNTQQSKLDRRRSVSGALTPGQGPSSSAASSATLSSPSSKLDLSNVKSFSKSRGPMKISPLNMQLQSSKMSGPRTPMTATLDSPIGVPGNVIMPSSYASFGWTPTEWSRWGTDKGRSIHLGKKKSVLLGMENFGNTCYANSVLQALYHCRPFRDAMMEPEEDSAEQMPPVSTPSAHSMQHALTNLFHSMALTASSLASNPRNGHIKKFHMPLEGRTAAIIGDSVERKALESFLGSLRNSSNLFDCTMHHDAHEFLNFLLNQVGEDLEKKQSKKQRKQSVTSPTGDMNKTFVNRLFQGVLTNETRCLSCETITSRDEEFLDLSINVAPYTSVSSCLRLFSESEMLAGRNKFFCDTCSSLQEAEKRMKIKSSPSILALHLKRFRYDENINAYIKHACRVVFPLDLRLFNSSDESNHPDRLYELVGIVIHVGSGVHQGHYVSIVKIGSRWALFDDEEVQFIPESDISKYYGDAPEIGSAYVLFYQTVSKDRTERDRQEMTTPGTPQSDMSSSATSANFRKAATMARATSASYSVISSSPLSPRHSSFHPPTTKAAVSGMTSPSSLSKPVSPPATNEASVTMMDLKPTAEPVASLLSKNQEHAPPIVHSVSVKEPLSLSSMAETTSSVPTPAIAPAPSPTVTAREPLVSGAPPSTVKLYEPVTGLGPPTTKAGTEPSEKTHLPTSRLENKAGPEPVPGGGSSTLIREPKTTASPPSSNVETMMVPVGPTPSAPEPKIPAAVPAALLGPASDMSQSTRDKPVSAQPASRDSELDVVTVGPPQTKDAEEPAKRNSVTQPSPSLYRSGSTTNLVPTVLPWSQDTTASSTLTQTPQASSAINKVPQPSQHELTLPSPMLTEPQVKPAISLTNATNGSEENATSSLVSQRRPMSMFGSMPIRISGQSSLSTSPGENVLSASPTSPQSMSPANQLNLPTPPMTPMNAVHPMTTISGSQDDVAMRQEPPLRPRRSLMRQSMAFSPSMTIGCDFDGTQGTIA
ncbi:unnamed protein product [Malassezia sympodialis ATCC 42132]|uniref:uncharacterized protein n=1 Tax=Malassezia sympodialis (strain ATCC 42132) TaxID=1230383 RepID=UPI0002C275B5|nr:uncharacterized protein MSY001_2047 [Malassezia sympodialis ATCC 42132]CCU99341.1 unnamed protein product [Malassezia sympodialis ATCC 42132]|eukprot:XP_018740595.1 uncharacterized protein MSY001_2047 [Malassezia sympodialis ATCC 42132]